MLVLIDTWWNVNILTPQSFGEEQRFNRYMVECEYTEVRNAGIECQSFNRYMVECELIFIDVVYLFYIVLIDTWWNVNVSVI